MSRNLPRLLFGALTWPLRQWRRIHRKFRVGALLQLTIIVANAAATSVLYGRPSALLRPEVLAVAALYYAFVIPVAMHMIYVGLRMPYTFFLWDGRVEKYEAVKPLLINVVFCTTLIGTVLYIFMTHISKGAVTAAAP